MGVASFRAFGGEIPRLPADNMPEGAAQEAINVDLQHADLMGLRADAPFTRTPAATAVRGIYSDDGTNFFGWPYDVYAVRSMVVNDLYHRLYYTALLADGPIIKVARTRRSYSGNPDGDQVAGSFLVGGQFQPPEQTGPGLDSWVLGVPAPRVQAASDDDRLTATLVDKAQWPGAPNLQLKVTYFLEDPTGKIVFQQSITNSELAYDPITVVPVPGVYWTNDWRARGNKVQDMLWGMGQKPRPFKYYFYDPPDASADAVSRVVELTNNGDGDVVITYDGTTSTPQPDPWGGTNSVYGNDA